ncbi:hypothetical protein ACHAQJ_004009 [Trichoderma viride]
MGKPVLVKTGHATARVNGTVIAEATTWRETEGSVYFPPENVKSEFFTSTDLSTYCPWKGDASYFSIDAGGHKLENAAWYYKQPFEGAVDLRDHVAFYKNKVDVTVD